MLFLSKKITSFTDEQLIGHFRKTRDNRYFDELFGRYYHLVYGVCLKYLKDRDESKEMVIAIFEKVFSDIFTKEIETFHSWLYVVTKNECLMKLRSDKRRETRESVFNELTAEPCMVQHHDEDSGKTDELLHESIKTLKPEQKTCIELFFLHDLSYREIAYRTGFDEKAVKSHIQNGKRNLYLKLKEQKLT